MEIGKITYNLKDINFFMNPAHYKKSNLTNISSKKIIAITDDKKKFAVDRFNGRISNWYSLETGKSNNWADDIYTLDKNLVFNKFQVEFNIALKKQEIDDIDTIKNIENKINYLKEEIENIKNKKTLKWNFINQQEKTLNSLKKTLNITCN